MDRGSSSESEDAPGEDGTRFETATLLPLRELCHLYILGNLHRYSPSYLGLLPPTLRRQILTRLPAIDLHALEGTPVVNGIDVNDIWTMFFDRPWLKGVTKNISEGTDRKKALLAEIHKSTINGGVIPYHSVNPHYFRRFCHETGYLLELTTSTLLACHAHSLPTDLGQKTVAYSQDFLAYYSLQLVCGRCLAVRPIRFDTGLPKDHLKSFSCTLLPFPVNKETYQLMHILKQSFQYQPEELEFFFHSSHAREISIDPFGYQVVVNYYSGLKRLAVLCSEKIPCSANIDDHHVTNLLSEITRHSSPSLKHLVIELSPSCDLSEKFLLSIYPYLTGVWLKGVSKDSGCGHIHPVVLESLSITCAMSTAVANIIASIIHHQPFLSYLTLHDNKTERPQFETGLIQSSLGTSLTEVVERVRYLKLVSVVLPSSMYGSILTLHFLSTHSHSTLHLSHTNIGPVILNSNVVLHTNCNKTLTLDNCQTQPTILNNFSHVNFGTLKVIESNVPRWSSHDCLSCLNTNKHRLSMKVLELHGFSPDNDPLPPSQPQKEFVCAMLLKPFLTELTLRFYDYQNTRDSQPLMDALGQHGHTVTTLKLLTFHDCVFSSRPDKSSLAMLLETALLLLKLSPSFSLCLLNCTITRDTKSVHFLSCIKTFHASWSQLPDVKPFKLFVIPEVYFNILKTTENNLTLLHQMTHCLLHDTEYFKQVHRKD